jgi:branched-chain amino acid transport system substrate-binding protein
MTQSIRRIVAVLAVLATAVAVAACSSDDSSHTSSAPSGATTTATTTTATTTTTTGTTTGTSNKQATGKPIVTWGYTDVNTEGPQYKNLEETTRAFEKWVNSHGGIAGRPLDAHFCDSRGTPTAAAACAREAVQGKAVAVVGSFSFTGDAVTPILENGKTALFGGPAALSPSEFTSPISFPLGNSPLYGVGLVHKAIEQGCKKIVGVIIQGAESFIPLMNNAAKAEGAKIQKFITLPATARDFSPQVAEATANGTDCLVMVVSETPFIAWMPAFKQSGSKARMYGPQGNFDPKVAKGFEDVVEKDVIAGMYPDISLPQWKDYREALQQANVDKDQDYNSLGGLGIWAAYAAFKQVVEGMTGPVNNQTFLAAVKTAKINLPGILPPLDMSKTWGSDGGPKEFAQIVNRCGTYSEFQGGKLVPLGNTYVDLSVLGGGTKPTDCGPAFGG